jgi:hypothetical protein
MLTPFHYFKSNELRTFRDIKLPERKPNAGSNSINAGL